MGDQKKVTAKPKAEGPVKNTFSALSEAERREQLKKVQTQLPWEKPGYEKPRKPPGKC